MNNINRDKLERMWNKGFLLKDIAKEFGVSMSWISTNAQRLGLPRRNPGNKLNRPINSDSNTLNYQIFYNVFCGYTQSEIATMLRISRQAVSYRLVKYRKEKEAYFRSYEVNIKDALKSTGGKKKLAKLLSTPGVDAPKKMFTVNPLRGKNRKRR